MYNLGKRISKNKFNGGVKRRSKTRRLHRGGVKRRSKTRRLHRGGEPEKATEEYKKAEAELKPGFGLEDIVPKYAESTGNRRPIKKISGIYFNDILFMDNTSVTGKGGRNINEFYYYKIEDDVLPENRKLIELSDDHKDWETGYYEKVVRGYLVENPSIDDTSPKTGICLFNVPPSAIDSNPYVLGFNTYTYELPSLLDGRIPVGTYIICNYVIEYPYDEHPLRLFPINNIEKAKETLAIFHVPLSQLSDTNGTVSTHETRGPVPRWQKPRWFYYESGTTLNKI